MADSKFDSAKEYSTKIDEGAGYDLQRASVEMMEKTKELLQGSQTFKELVEDYNEDKLDAEKLKKKVKKEVPTLLKKVEKLKDSLIRIGKVIEQKAVRLVEIVELGKKNGSTLPKNSVIPDNYGLIPVMFKQVRDRIHDTFGELEVKGSKNPELKPVFEALNEIKESLGKLAAKAEEMTEQLKEFLNKQYYQDEVPPKEDPEMERQLGELIGTPPDKK